MARYEELLKKLRRTKTEYKMHFSSLGFGLPSEESREVAVNPDGETAAQAIELLLAELNSV